MVKKRQYYFSNSRFNSFAKKKKRKYVKLLIFGAFVLLVMASIFIGNKILVNREQSKHVNNGMVSSASSYQDNFQVNQEKNDVKILITEDFFDGTVTNAKNDISTMEDDLSDFKQEIVDDTLVFNAKEQDNEEMKVAQEPEEGITINGSLQVGDTLYDSLIKEGISAAEILELQEKLKSFIDCNYIPAGAKYALHYDPEGKLKEFVYEPSPIDVFHINFSESESTELKVVKEDVQTEIVKIDGVIQSSLYESMMECSESPQLALQIADIFGWQIDFLTECREGDTFNILVEKEQKGEDYRWGKVIAAQYEGELLSEHTAILFEDPSGHIDYYNEKGESLKRAFLRAPLNYKYISSYFSKSRFHPILRIWRPHLAIDYAAPTGTPISTIGDGTVIFAGWQNGYGNYIQIRHPNNYVTGYGHLSRFAKGLKKGNKVSQGEIIGYVGATGLATGPHLDFSISKNGERVDFLKLDLPSASSVDSQYLSEFEQVKSVLLDQLKGEVASVTAMK